MKKTFTILLMMLCGCCGFAQVDTVRFGDPCWLFNNDTNHHLCASCWSGVGGQLDSVTPYGFLETVQPSYFTSMPYCFIHACMWDVIPIGVYDFTLLQEFVLEEPTDLYGIAITMGLRDEKYHNPISAVLYQKDESGQMRLIDSVPWNPSWHEPHGRFEYVGVWDYNMDTVKTYAPVYKYYFDRPHYAMADTIYVGFFSGIDPGWPNVENHNSVMFGCYHPLVLNDELVTNLNQTCWTYRISRLPWGSTGDPLIDSLHMISAYSVMTSNLWWLSDGVFPIVEPNVADAIPACKVPDSLHVSTQTGNYLILEWDEVGMSLGYQLSYGDYRNDPDSNRIVSLGIPRMGITIDTGIYYAARVRSQCRHSCTVHDTVMWSDWSEPVFFYAGTMPDTATVGIAEAESAHITIAPNPTSGRVRVSAGEPMRQAAVYDMAGKEVFSAKAVVPKTEWDLDLSSLPSGSYIVKIATKSRTATRKLIVE